MQMKSNNPNSGSSLDSFLASEHLLNTCNNSAKDLYLSELEAKLNFILKEANNALVVTDNSDYKGALWSILHECRPDWFEGDHKIKSESDLKFIEP